MHFPSVSEISSPASVVVPISIAMPYVEFSVSTLSNGISKASDICWLSSVLFFSINSGCLSPASSFSHTDTPCPSPASFFPRINSVCTCICSPPSSGMRTYISPDGIVIQERRHPSSNSFSVNTSFSRGLGGSAFCISSIIMQHFPQVPFPLQGASKYSPCALNSSSTVLFWFCCKKTRFINSYLP